MNTFDINLQRFADAVFADAENEKRQLMTELEAKRTERFEHLENEILSEAYDEMQAHIAAIRNESAAAVSAATVEERSSLIALRSELEEKVFAAAAARIEAFRGTADYPALLERQAAAAADQIGSHSCVIRLRADDMALADRLCALFSSAAAEADAHIALGGFSVLCPEANIVIDQTFDSRFAEARQRFRSTSGLTINE